MRSAILPLLLLALLALPACNDDSPTDPDVTERFTGTVLRGTRVDHPLPLPHGGNVTLTLEDLTFRLLDVTVTDPALISLVVGIGQPSVLDGLCVSNTTVLMREGSVHSVALRAGDYCLVVRDSGFLPEESVAEYTLLSEFTD